MRRWQKIVLGVLLELLILALVGLVAVSYYFARTVLSSAPLAARPPVVEQPHNPAFAPITLTTLDGLRLAGFYSPSQTGKTIILLHGYRASHVEMLPIADILVHRGYGVLLFDFRGHGASQGEEITFGKKEVLDVDAAYQYLVQHEKTPPSGIGILGDSMGASIAILYSAQHPEIHAVVAQSPYNSLKDVIWTNTTRTVALPPILLCPLVQFWVEQRLGLSVDQIAPIRQVHAIAPRPIFILMGGQDVMTDPNGGQLLVQAAGQPKQYWYDPQVGHLEFPEKRPVEFETRVMAFFDQNLH